MLILINLRVVQHPIRALNVGENGQRPAGEEYHARFTT